MENTQGNFKGHGAHRRFFGWAMQKMTGEEAFDIVYGEKGGAYPKEMKEEFVLLFEQTKAAHAKLRQERMAFLEKWKEYAPQDGHMVEHGPLRHGHNGHFDGECPHGGR